MIKTYKQYSQQGTTYYLKILWKKVQITSKEYTMINNIIKRVKFENSDNINPQFEIGYTITIEPIHSNSEKNKIANEITEKIFGTFHPEYLRRKNEIKEK